MAVYKVWLTVKDRYGRKKEIDSGNIIVGLDEVSSEEIAKLDDTFATDTEIAATIANNDKIRYSSFELAD